jgi:hypothetical protein
MTEDNSFSGFMPMVSNITIGQVVTMINTEGELVEAHSVAVKVVDLLLVCAPEIAGAFIVLQLTAVPTKT